MILPAIAMVSCGNFIEIWNECKWLLWFFADFDAFIIMASLFSFGITFFIYIFIVYKISRFILKNPIKKVLKYISIFFIVLIAVPFLVSIIFDFLFHNI